MIKKLYILQLNKNYIFFNKYKTYKEKNLFEFGNQILPVRLSLVKLFETVEKKILYTLDNCEEEALKIASEKLLLDLGKDDIILSKKVLKKQLKNSKIIVEVFFKVKEDITSYKEIVIEEAKEEGD